MNRKATPRKTPASRKRRAPAGKPPPSARTRMKPDDRRESLLELGKRLFGEMPYDQLSMDDVAKVAGISKGLLYHYFPTKRELYKETIRAAVAELTERTAPDLSLGPVEQLQSSLVDYLSYVRDHAATYRRIMGSGVGADEEVKAIIDVLRNIVIQRVLDGLAITQPAEVLLVALHGWVGFIEAASLAWLDRTDLPQEVIRVLLVTNLAASISATGTVDISDHIAAVLGSSPG